MKSTFNKEYTGQGIKEAITKMKGTTSLGLVMTATSAHHLARKLVEFWQELSKLEAFKWKKLEKNNFG